jgi:hypothetical protein
MRFPVHHPHHPYVLTSGDGDVVGQRRAHQVGTAGGTRHVAGASAGDKRPTSRSCDASSTSITGASCGAAWAAGGATIAPLTTKAAESHPAARRLMTHR